MIDPTVYNRLLSLLYYTSTSSGQIFTSEPSGPPPDLERLIRGEEKAWPVLSYKRKQKQKKIIFSDWTASNWSKERIEDGLELFRQLFKEGFEIYLWQEGELITVTPEIVETLLKSSIRRLAITFASTEEIQREAARQLKISADALYLLDCAAVQRVLDPTQKIFPLIRTSDIASRPDWEQRDIVFRLTACDAPPPAFLHDEFSEEALRIYAWLEETGIVPEDYAKILCPHPQDKNNNDLMFEQTGVSFSSDDDQREHYEKIFSKINLAIPKDKFPKLKIYLKDYRSPNAYIDIIDGGNKEYLRSIYRGVSLGSKKIGGFENISYFDCGNTPFSQAGEFQFSITDHAALQEKDGIKLKKFFGTALTFYSSSLSEFYEAPNFPLLNKLTLKNVTLRSWKILEHFASFSPHLRTISLTHVLVKSEETIAPFSLPEIRNIHLHHYSQLDYQPSMLHDLFAAAPNLHSLQLEGYFDRCNHYALKHPYPLLKNLRRLTLNIDDNAFEYQHILDASANIYHLEVINDQWIPEYYNNKDTFLHFGHLTFPNLRHVSFTIGNTLDIEALLQAAPRLMSITVFTTNHFEGHLSQKYPPDPYPLGPFNPQSEWEIKELLALVQREIEKQKKIIHSQKEKIPLPIAKMDFPENADSYPRSQKIDSYTSPPAQAWINADTKLTDKKISGRVFFYDCNGEPVLPESYRINIYDTLQVSKAPCDLSHPFQFFRSNRQQQLEPISARKTNANLLEYVKKKGDGETFYGIVEKITLGKDWIPLPGLSPHDEISLYRVSGNASIDIGRFDDGLYYVKSLSKSQCVDIDFVLRSPPQPPAPSLIPEIREKIKEMQGYGGCALVIDTASPTGEDYMNAILNQKMGACRHRVAALMYWMNTHYPSIAKRAIFNDVHAYIELLIDNAWVRFDLGGHPAELELIGRKKEYAEEKAAAEESSVEEEKSAAHFDSPSTPHEIKQVMEEKTYLAVQHQTFNPFRGYFKPLIDKKNFPSVTSWCHYLFKGPQKTFIKMEGAKSLSALKGHLYKYGKNISRPVFFVDKPEDLCCPRSYFKKLADGTAHLQKEQGGRLYDFLKKYADERPLLVVDLSRFTAEDIVRLNTLFDPTPTVDGVSLPQGISVIGLMDTTDPDCYQGADLISRFDRVIERCPFSEDRLSEDLAAWSSEEKPSANAYYINLYHSSDWKLRLAGGWVPDINGRFIWQAGAFENAISSGCHSLHIDNGPWEDPLFRSFVSNTFQRKRVEQAAGEMELPADFRLTYGDGYDFTDLMQHIQNADALHFCEDEKILNPTTFFRFFSGFICDEGRLKPESGWIQTRPASVLPVYLTCNLSDDQWAMLLAECKKHRVTLSVRRAPDVEDSTSVVSPFLSTVSSFATHEKDRVIRSNDPDSVVRMLCEPGSLNTIVMDVSECSVADLLTSMDAAYDDDADQFSFHTGEKILSKELKKGNKVILTGCFSDTIKDAMTAFLFERAGNASVTGHLILVPQNSNFESVSNGLQQDVLPSQKYELLKRHFPEEKAVEECLGRIGNLIEIESLSRLHSRLLYLLRHPEDTSSNGENAWKGLSSLEIKMPAADIFDLNRSREKAEIFTQERIQSVLSVLKNSPCVFLAGLTGTGKTTFVEKELCQQGKAQLYSGEKCMQDWAKDTSSLPKYLFIDEANLSPSEWSCFEGLFSDPPAIVIDGEYYPLDKHHKVIFAGNPVNYGDERHMAPFFERHGCSVVFDPLPPAVIFEKVLKPVFENQRLGEEDILLISQSILSAYAFICPLSRREVCVTPRELQSMALLSLSLIQKNPHIPCKIIIDEVIRLIAGPLVPIEYADHFATLFPPAESILPQPESEQEFLITPSRMPAASLLEAMLDLRAFRQNGCNDAQRFGGINGLVLEGPPGTGKSELVISLLLKKGYKEAGKSFSPAEKLFYRIPANLSPQEKEKRLIEASKMGAVAVMDEINSCPANERLLNRLLSDPSAETPGFMLIGTQNPITMAGRRAFSNALARRLPVISIPEYPKNEIINILIHAGMDPLKATQLAEAWLEDYTWAMQHQATPPTFRQVMRAAHQILGRSDVEETISAAREEEAPAEEKFEEKFETEPVEMASAVNDHADAVDMTLHEAAELDALMNPLQRENPAFREACLVLQNPKLDERISLLASNPALVTSLSKWYQERRSDRFPKWKENILIHIYKKRENYVAEIEEKKAAQPDMARQIGEEYGHWYLQETDHFCTKAATLILNDNHMDDTFDDNAREDIQARLGKLAHDTFTHRHWALRVIADILCVFTLGLVWVVRVCTHRSAFFSTDKTDREQKFEQATSAGISKADAMLPRQRL